MYAELLLAFLVTASADPGDQTRDTCGKLNVECWCEPENEDLIMNLYLFKVRDPETNEMKCKNLNPYQLCENYNCTYWKSRLSTSFQTEMNGNSTHPFFSRNYYTAEEETDDETEIQDNFLANVVFLEDDISDLNSETDDETGIQDISIENDIFFEDISIPELGFPDGHRVTRDTKCPVSSLKNANIRCTKWPEIWIKCKIKCLPGHVLKSTNDMVEKIGIYCMYQQNVWKPHGFQECQPYLNCVAHLIKPGEIQCKRPENRPAYCEIFCYAYEGKEATPLKEYECVDENFGRTLPHCAVLAKDVKLVRKSKQSPEYEKVDPKLERL